MPSQLTFKVELSAAATPPSGYVTFYSVGGIIYWKDDAGVQHSIASGTGDLAADGTVPLTADWNVGQFKISAEQFESTITSGNIELEDASGDLLLESGDKLLLEQGAPPFIVASSAVVPNLNAQYLDGNLASAFATAAQGTTADAAVPKATFDANTILKADSDDTPAALTVGEQTLVGRITAGSITALTAAQVRTLLNIEDGADVTDETNVISSLDGATITPATVATGDKVLVQDVDDSDNLKTVTAQAIADLAAAASSPLTTKGDIWAYDTGDNRLPVGTDGQVLKADSGAGLGVSWQDESAGGSVASDAIWDAAGDLAVGTGADTAAKLTKGNALEVLRVNSGGTALEWAKAVGKKRHQFYAETMSVFGGSVKSTCFGGRLSCLELGPAGFEQCKIPFKFPKNWDGGQIRFRAFYVPSSTDTGDAKYIFLADAFASGEDLAFETTSTSVITETQSGVVDRLRVGTWSGLITPGGSPDDNHYTLMRMQRQGDDGGDSFTGDMDVIAIEIEYTTNALTDD